MRRIATTLLCLAALLACAACAKQSKPANGKLCVSVTFNALREFASAVGGDLVEVTAIIPDGMEPHDFEPKAKDMAALGASDVFVRNGLGLEAWADKALAASGGKKLVVVDASAGADPIRLGADGADPHLWLGVKGAELQARNVQAGFEKADPAHAEAYRKNADAYIAELEKLYAEYGPRMKAAKRKGIITGHAAFGYLCRDFGLTQDSVEDVFESGEPTAQQLARLVEEAKAKRVKTIFSEELASPAVSKALASEVGAKVETIYTMESAEDGKSYLERMRDNLEAIARSLEE